MFEHLDIEALEKIVNSARTSKQTSHMLAMQSAENSDEVERGIVRSSNMLAILVTDDLAAYALEKHVRSLSRGALSEVIAVMLVGREDCRVSQFMRQVANINGAPDTYDVEYLCAKLPMLPQYLTKGIMLLRESRL